jgi:hypothetical protein
VSVTFLGSAQPKRTLLSLKPSRIYGIPWILPVLRRVELTNTHGLTPCDERAGVSHLFNVVQAYMFTMLKNGD